MVKNTKKVVLTPAGLKKLEDELEYLKVEKRKEIAEKIKIARGFGDLSENAEYVAAKEEQGNMEIRIAEIKKILENAEIIDDSEISTDTVSIGAKVKVLDVEFEEEEEYYIVGSTEADPSQNKISDESPVGKALIGRKIGETIDVEIPSGTISFKILEITK